MNYLKEYEFVYSQHNYVVLAMRNSLTCLYVINVFKVWLINGVGYH